MGELATLLLITGRLFSDAQPKLLPLFLLITSVMFLLLMIVTFSCFCQILIDTLELFDLTFAQPMEYCSSKLSLSACQLPALSFGTLFLVIILSITDGLSSVQYTTRQ